jgi:uncharacterized protein YrzB (UPF0473 family)
VAAIKTQGGCAVPENADVITLLDEDGTEHEFSVVDVLDVDEHRYAILQPVADGQESDTAVIFRMEDDALVTIEDDAEFERVRQAFEDTHADDDAGDDSDEPSGEGADISTEERGSTSH